MLYKFTTLMLVILFVGFVQAQNRISHQTQPKVVFTGFEVVEDNGNPVTYSNAPLSFDSFVSGGLTWDMHPISVNPNGYDLQSNSSSQQIWCDLNTPLYLHAIHTFSALGTGYSDRTTMYYGSTDGGVNWFALGGVPVNTGTEGHSGYGVIAGLSTGEAVIMNHILVDSPQRPLTQLWIDTSPLGYGFVNHDPGKLTDSNPYVLWPRCVVDGSDNIIFASSQSTNYGAADSFYTNHFTFATSVFDGYKAWNGDQAETYPFAISDQGTIGQTFLGQDIDLPNSGDVFYRVSTTGGLTWEAPQKIYTRDHSNDTTWGAMRGLTLNYYNDQPCIAFETAWQDFVGGTYRQGDANELYFWSPNVNGGTPKVLIDTSWAHWNPGGGANDVMLGVCRPVLSRSQSGNYLLLAFSAATDVLDVTNDSSPFFDGYFMYSTDGGETWTEPEKFTPDMTPPVDWKHISMPQISPVHPSDEDVVTVHISVQGDTVAGSGVQGSSNSVSAYFYHFTTEIAIVNAGSDPLVVNEFNLEQNYPNPFNPSTSINYTLAERTTVNLKVYDVLGKEVATLVNDSQDAGKHTVSFDASNLASGLYIYTLNAGNFTSSRKMMLLK